MADFDLILKDISPDLKVYFDEFRKNATDVNHCDQLGNNILIMYLRYAYPVEPETVKHIVSLPDFNINQKGGGKA
jgi:hypothetical protein